MAKRKETKKYYFSVEGETEHWYLKWLQNIINSEEQAKYRVSLECPVMKNPVKYVKSLIITGKTEIYHFFDYEGEEELHVQRFMSTMDNMKKAQGLGKQILYKSGYSNLTFDLWLILHKIECNSFLAHRKQYITFINRVFDEHFENMAEFKEKEKFKRCLSKLQLCHVIDAVKRAKTITQRNQENGYCLYQYKSYRYYKENPSLAVWEPAEKILKDCKLI